MDPATRDRRTTLIAGVDQAELPRRRMTIAGLEGTLDARILSKDMSGPATRLVFLPAGWGSSLAGSFSAGIEIFVLSGRLSLGDQVMTARDYVAIPGGKVIPGLRSHAPGSALVLTEAPLRYDTVTGGAAANVSVVRSADVAWEPLPGGDGRFLKRLRADASSDVFLVGALEWQAAGAAWSRHPSAEEVYVIDGHLTITELEDGVPAAHDYGGGGYLWRPPGSLHGGPGSVAADTALTFHRLYGAPLSVDRVNAGGAAAEGRI